MTLSMVSASVIYVEEPVLFHGHFNVNVGIYEYESDDVLMEIPDFRNCLCAVGPKLKQSIFT